MAIAHIIGVPIQPAYFDSHECRTLNVLDNHGWGGLYPPPIGCFKTALVGGLPTHADRGHGRDALCRRDEL